jgi:hypothetical protein
MKPEKEPFAPYMNSVRKYVVSTTLDKAEWNNSVLITGNLIEEVNKLKQHNIALDGFIAGAMVILCFRCFAV